MEIKRISVATPEIANEIVSIHLAVLVDSFLNSFGENFLKIIYTNLINSSETICLVLYDNNKISGFALATKDYSVFLKKATEKEGFYLLYLIFINLIFKPINIYKLMISLPALVFSKETPHAELQFIGVSLKSQGKRFGSALIKRLSEEFMAMGINQFYVGTKANNEPSNKFYKKIGFTRVYTKSYFGDTLNYYLSP